MKNLEISENIELFGANYSTFDKKLISIELADDKYDKFPFESLLFSLRPSFPWAMMDTTRFIGETILILHLLPLVSGTVSISSLVLVFVLYC